ncbi:putative membrane protein [Acetobacteraceae bacterium AT-5844]|nr:putative membrane protein [Acetobacteraceae bacterium AT-5844]
MAGAAVLFSLEALFVRWMTARGIPVTTQLMFRAAGQLLWILPLLRAGGFSLLRTRHAPLHILRGSCSLATWALYYFSLGFLDLATATALSFTNVMATTLLAGPLLKEKVGPLRWAGVMAGFAGVCVMLRPWEGAGLMAAAPIGVAAALGSSITWCGLTVTTRMLTRTEGTGTILAWVGLVTTLGVLPFAIWGWQPVGLGDLALLAAFAIFTPGIIYLMTEAFRFGEASAVGPFQYLRLPIMALTGWAIYAEAPDGMAWLGAGIILAGAAIVSSADARPRR